MITRYNFCVNTGELEQYECVHGGYVEASEVEAIISDLDNALAQNAELVAQVEALRDACLDYENMETPNAWGLIFDEIKRCANATPTQHLRDRDAEFVEMAIKSCVIVECFGTPCISVRGLTQYAEKVRRGEV